MTTELDQLARDMLSSAKDFKGGKPSAAFLKKESKKLRQKTLSLAKNRVNKKTGNLFKGIKSGKVYVWKGIDQAVRVYGGKPAFHLHLLEYGHRIIYKDGREIKTAGKYFFRDAHKQYEDKFVKNCGKFVIELMEEHGMR